MVNPSGTALESGDQLDRLGAACGSQRHEAGSGPVVGVAQDLQPGCSPTSNPTQLVATVSAGVKMPVMAVNNRTSTSRLASTGPSRAATHERTLRENAGALAP
jgi:hypothetical protein